MLLQIEKLHPLFGAEVGNIDLSKPIDQAGIDAIQAALDKYNRLSANPRTSVLLVEAGGSDRHPYIATSAGFLKTFADPRFNWCFTI